MQREFLIIAAVCFVSFFSSSTSTTTSATTATSRAVAPFPCEQKDAQDSHKCRDRFTIEPTKNPQESIKSKRHLKSLLTSLKNSGKVKTTPNASGRSYGYSIRQGPRQKSSSGD